MFQRLFQSYRLQHELIHYLKKNPDCTERHEKHEQEIEDFVHDKNLFDEYKRDTDTAGCDLEKPELIKSFVLIRKDSESLAHFSVVQKMPGLDYLNHDDQDFQNLRVSLFQCVSDSF
jgi:hypothetical protein